MARTKEGRFLKGSSGNPSGRPKKKGVISHTVVNSHIAPERTKADGKVGFKKEDWIPFGSDNLFPQALAGLSRKSPVHRAILNSKTTYTTGKGFSGDDRLLDYLSAVNGKETFQTVFNKLIYDEYLHGNAYLELVERDGLIMFHKDATKARLHKDGKSVLFHPNWAKVKKTKELLVEIPLYPNFKRVNGENRSVLHMKSYEPEFSFYGIPDYIAAIDSAGIAYKTNKWNISRLDNSFQSSGVLLVSGDMSTDDAESLKEAVKDEFTGEGNQGKILFIAKNLGGEGETEFIPINTGNEGDWTQLHEQSTSELIISHSWFPSLSGIQTAGQLGNTQEIRNSYQIALNTVISTQQQFMLSQIGRVLTDFGFNVEDWEVVNKPPVNILDTIDMNFVVKKGEARAMAGLEVDDSDPTNEEFVKNGTTDNTTRGNQ